MGASQQIFAALEQVDWEKVLPKAYGRAFWRALNSGLVHYDNKKGFGGWQPDDLVNQLICDLYAGDRTDWNPEEETILEWITSHLMSVTSNVRTKQAHKLEQSFDALDNALKATDRIELRGQELAGEEGVVTPEKELIAKETAEAKTRFLMDAASGDVELEILVDTVKETGKYKRRDLAEELGVTVDEITNMKKRLKTAVMSLRKRRSNDGSKEKT